MAEDTPREIDVLIVGAGVNGAGLFRDLCEQGLTCMIVDKGDFGSGTSAAPSRLIHGGLKYLETGEFRLVAESTYERNLLLRNAPHLVRPLPTMIPILSWFRGLGPAIRTFFGAATAPRSRGALLVKIGLRLYDFYGSRARAMPRHRMIGRSRALQDIPALTPAIVAVGTYYDAAITAPERLVLELVKDGLAAQPSSEAHNWTSITGLADGIVELIGPSGNRSHVRPGLVVNAAGPWIDRVNAVLGLDTRLIGGTKGSHIVLDHPELVRQLDGRMLYFEADDGRILLVYPYLGKALVGSTDIPAQEPDSVRCEAAEVEYFLHSLRMLLPGLRFEHAQILYTYAGIRPLPNSEGLAPGMISRDHSAPVHEPDARRTFPVISLVGGKWTTFRAFAEQVADTVLARRGTTRRVSTADLPIGGGRGMPKDEAARAKWVENLARSSEAKPERIETLLGRYGTTARDIAAAEGPGPAMVPGTVDTSAAEIAWIARNEMVEHLADILLRRTQLAITGQLTAENVAGLCSIAGQVLGWDAERQAQEVRSTLETLATRHGLSL